MEREAAMADVLALSEDRISCRHMHEKLTKQEYADLAVRPGCRVEITFLPDHSGEIP